MQYKKRIVHRLMDNVLFVCRGIGLIRLFWPYFSNYFKKKTL